MPNRAIIPNNTNLNLPLEFPNNTLTANIRISKPTAPRVWDNNIASDTKTSNIRSNFFLKFKYSTTNKTAIPVKKYAVQFDSPRVVDVRSKSTELSQPLNDCNKTCKKT